MAQRVHTGCPDCTRCTNSAINNAGRAMGRAAAGMMTLGASELVTRKCKGCGHAMSLHGRADNARWDAQANPAAGAAWGAQAPAPYQPVQPQQPYPTQQPQPGAFPPPPGPGYGYPPANPYGAQPPARPPMPHAAPPAPAQIPAPPASEPAAWTPNATTTADEIAGRLKRLDALRDAGAITDAEHAAQRTRILDAL
ncbi:SHOCT domain-containing protein [Streptomyces laurentii]|uniref:SHOCT domain-containing protein n=1 Tax=Streptomyces laurentii TaxID=39478 RepID=UPI0036ACBDD6